MGANQTPAAASWFFSERRVRTLISRGEEYSQCGEEGFRVVLRADNQVGSERQSGGWRWGWPKGGA